MNTQKYTVKEITTAVFAATCRSWMFLHDIYNCIKFIQGEAVADLRQISKEFDDDPVFRADDAAIYLRKPAEKSAFLANAKVDEDLLYIVERWLGRR